MDELELFLQTLEKPEVIDNYVYGKYYDIGSIMFCGFNTDSDFETWIGKQFTEATRTFASQVEKEFPFTQKISFFGIITTRIERALADFYFQELNFHGIHTKQVLHKKTKRIKITGEFNPEAAITNSDVECEPFLIILKDFGERFRDYLKNFQSLLPNLQTAPVRNIPIKEVSNIDKILWKKSSTDLVELITALIKSGSIYRDKHTPLTKKDAYQFFGIVFSFELKNPDSLLSRATTRKKDHKEGSNFLKHLQDTYIEYRTEKDK